MWDGRIVPAMSHTNEYEYEADHLTRTRQSLSLFSRVALVRRIAAFQDLIHRLEKRSNRRARSHRSMPTCVNTLRGTCASQHAACLAESGVPPIPANLLCIYAFMESDCVWRGSMFGLWPGRPRMICMLENSFPQQGLEI